MNEIDTQVFHAPVDSMKDDDFSTSEDGNDFCIDDADRANWLVRRIIEARAYGTRVRSWAAKEEKRAKCDEERLLFLFGRQLEHWVAAELAASRQKRRSVPLPAGTVGFRRTGLKLIIEDHDAVIRWAKHYLPDAIITKEFLSKSALTGLAMRTGEIPCEGARLLEAEDKFFIR